MTASFTNVVPDTHGYRIAFGCGGTGSTIRNVGTKKTVLFVLNDAIANRLR
jgi:hypothetical protein